MASDDRRRHRPSPTHPPRARTRHTAEREERKEHGTPEKSRTRKPRDQSPERPHRRRNRTPDRSPRQERTPQKRRSPERRERKTSPERREKSEREKIVVEYEDSDNQSVERSPPRPPPSQKRASHQRTRSPQRRSKTVVEEKHESYDSYSTVGSTAPLSLDALAKLDALNEKSGGRIREREKKERQYSVKRSAKEKVVTGRVAKEKVKHRRRSDGTYKDERRRISGPLLEEGGGGKGRRGGYLSVDERSGKRRFGGLGGRKTWIALGLLVLVVVIVVVAVVVSKKKSNGNGGSDGAKWSGGDPSNDELNGVSESDIPTTAKNTILDPFTWYDTTDFNVTYTNTTFGGLPIMGLNSTWNDTVQANQFVPALDKPWAYGQMPIRGVNVGGWLSIEPFITPSLFNTYKSNQGIIDEWTLSKQLGPTQAAQVIEKHYSRFITESDFAAIQAAGFDHVRIPYSYWAVIIYPGDPYVPKISWRYLLRAIEYARKYGLRVNLDLHALPGSQNGWNHSGKQGPIGWLNGTDGALNAQRSLDLHTQLSTFFAQPRYKNVITIYGLVNEPKMTELAISAVVDWTTSATQVVRKSGMKQTVAFGDGFLGLTKWQGQLQGVDGLVLDAHEYVIFDAALIAFNHTAKVNYACTGWTGQMKQSLDQTTGFGPTLCGEWSQADTDCTTYLNEVGAGTRWEGTLHSTDRSPSVLTPSCPAKSSACSCSDANADPSSYSDTYKTWLMTNAEAQMSSYETAWGWFYWTWKTESATQWDWKAGMAAGILPKKVWDRNFNCTGNLPSFNGLSENY